MRRSYSLLDARERTLHPERSMLLSSSVCQASSQCNNMCRENRLVLAQITVSLVKNNQKDSAGENGKKETGSSPVSIILFGEVPFERRLLFVTTLDALCQNPRLTEK